jgi:hypothetical protein
MRLFAVLSLMLFGCDDVSYTPTPPGKHWHFRSTYHKLVPGETFRCPLGEADLFHGGKDGVVECLGKELADD